MAKRNAIVEALRIAKGVGRKGYAWGGIPDMPAMEDPSEWLEMGGAKPIAPTVDQQLGLHRDFSQAVVQPLTGQPGGISSSGFVQNNRTTQLQESAQRIKSGEGSAEEHANLVNQFKPVSAYSDPVAPATNEAMQNALSKDKVGQLGAPRDLPAGYPAAVRLDIPAYQKNNTWVVSVHDPKTDYSAGKVIGYDSVAHLDAPTFGVQPKGAVNIAAGKPKSTIATVQGEWKPTTPDDAYALAKQIHNDPNWSQVGMDPERHAYFYDRSSMQPVVSADEALHIGPLVYAKNPIYGNPEDYPFANGGMVRKRYADGGSPLDIDPVTGLPVVKRNDDGGGGDGGGGDGGDGGGGGGGEKRGGFIRPKHRASGGMVEKAFKAVDDHRYKLRKHEDWGKHQNYKNSGGKISQMSPTEFLNKTEKMRMSDVDKDSIHHFKKKMKKGKSLNPLAIFPKGGQDGRHRAMAAKELGIKKVPVITWPGKSEGGSIVDRALVVASKSANRQRGRPQS